MLIDTNGDGVDDSREFAGSHRYDTAVKLAERFAAEEGSVSTAIVASGESQVDAVTAAGLAGNLNAPVLLTRSSMLPHNVARFIDQQNVTRVVVVGGSAAVSDSIVTRIESLGSRPKVERVSGADRYATAAAIGGELGGPKPTWCGSEQSAAILVNGGAAGRADAIAIGPLAFRLGLPILLTMADELPEATTAFLTDNAVERVVIVGGTSAVSKSVQTALVEDVGVTIPQRISGGSAAATSVMVAKEMLGNCAAVLETNPDMVALVNRSATADGITSAPLLGRGIDNDRAIPILLVDDELPAAVSDYLASTPEVRGGNKTHLEIVAIGGTAVVSDAVMADALAAAKTSSKLTATITPAKNPATGKYTNTFTVTYSDDIELPIDGTIDYDGSSGNVTGTALDPRLYRVNGVRIEADPATTSPQAVVLNRIYVEDRTVSVVLSKPLQAGDKIAVSGKFPNAGVSAGQIGDNDDKRILEDAELVLPEVTLAVDRAAPVVQLLGVKGQDWMYVYVTEPNLHFSELVGPGNNFDDYFEVRRGRTVLSSSLDEDFTLVDDPTTPWVETNRQGVTHRYVVRLDSGETLQKGDVISLKRNALIDLGGRGNSLARFTVPEPKNNNPDGGPRYGNFEISSASIGNVAHTLHASADLASGSMTITAKPTGGAAGAPGNDWRVYGYDERPDGVDNTNVWELSVAIDTKRQRISYTISEVRPARPLPPGQTGPRLFDLATALNADDTFAANFAVSYCAGCSTVKNDPLNETTPAGVALAGGESQVAIRVDYNDVVRGLYGREQLHDSNGSRCEWPFSGTYRCYTLVGDLAPTEDADPAAPGLQERVAADVYLMLSGEVVHMTFKSDNILDLPTREGFRVIRQPTAINYSGLPSGDADGDGEADELGVQSLRKRLSSLRPDASVKPAFKPPEAPVVDPILDIEIRGAQPEVPLQPATGPALVSAPSATIDEGGTYTYRLKLQSQPTATVRITHGVVTVDDQGAATTTPSTELSVSPTAIVFTPSNWDVAQEVTVTAAEDDNLVDDMFAVVHTAASSDANFTGQIGSPGIFTVTDNDSPSVNVSIASAVLDEDDAPNNAVTYSVSLGAQPAANESVVIEVVSGDGSLVTVAGSATTSLTFTASTWNQAQTVAVAAVTNAADTGDRTVTITHTLTTSSSNQAETPLYEGVTVGSVTITVLDNDTAGATVVLNTETSSGELSVTEGASDTFTVVLDSQPTADVTFTVTSSGDSDVTTDVTSRTFTPNNWETAQTVTVSAASDTDTADDSAMITLRASSADSNYDGMLVRVSVAVDDNT